MLYAACASHTFLHSTVGIGADELKFIPDQHSSELVRILSRSDGTRIAAYCGLARTFCWISPNFAMNDCTEKSEMPIKSVFHSLDPILRILRNERVSALQGVTELLDKFNVIYPEDADDSLNTQRRELFVVFEGLDGSGKSTIAKVVAKALNGIKMATPPKSISHLREHFDQYSPDVRRAFYSLGNYIAAKEIHTICQEKPVFLDRFWHSTAAYAVAQELDGQDLGIGALPAVGDPIYKWPADLLKPDLVLFLDVNESTRSMRHARRQKTTEEEEQLAKNEAFRRLVLAAYERMDDVPVIHVDSNVAVNQTKRTCLKHIKKFAETPRSVNS